MSIVRRLLRWLGLLALVGLVTLLLVEGLLWGFMRMDVELPVEQTYTQDIPGLKPEVSYSRNGLGLRTLSLQEINKPDRCVRVLVLGASSTDQATLDTEDMWLAQLETALNQSLEKRGITVQVAGRAAVGMRLRSQVKWVKHHLAALQPDIVITFLGINEMVSAESQNLAFSPESMNAYLDHLTREERFHEFSQIARYVTASRYELERRKQEASSQGVNVSVAWLDELRELHQQIPVEDALVQQPERTKTFTFLFDRLMEMLRGQHQEVIVLGTPVLAKADMTEEEEGKLWFFLPYPGDDMSKPDELRRLSPAVFREEMNRFNGVQRTLAKRYGAQYVPLESLIEPNVTNFFDDCHFTLEGTRQVAELVYPALESAVRKVVGEEGWSD